MKKTAGVQRNSVIEDRTIKISMVRSAILFFSDVTNTVSYVLQSRRVHHRICYDVNTGGNIL